MLTSPGCRSGWCRRTARNGKPLASGLRKGAWLSGGGSGRKNRLKSGRLRKNDGSAPAVLTGNPRRRIPYPLPAYGRKCADTEPVKLANTASAAEASFAGAGVQRAASPLCRGAGAAAHCWGQGATPIGRLRAAAIIGSRTKCLGGLRAAAPSGQGRSALPRES